MAQDDITGFWGSVAEDGTEIMVNLRRVRYARPQAGGTRLFFAPDDAITVSADFATVSKRLYQAFDAPDNAGPAQQDPDGQDKGGQDKGGQDKGDQDSSGDKQSG